jgi:NAD(P)-dependent dehydrogenase (short-subunit alcohol dehydrogenase family)
MNDSLDVFSLKGKVALVTGAGGGIGRSVCLRFAGAGANVALADINPNSLDAVSSEVRKFGGEALMVVTDVRKGDAVGKLVNQTIDKLGRVDILANVAGGMSVKQRGPAHELKEDIWDSVVDLNLKSVFLCSAAVARVMIDRKIRGSIINIGSVAGQIPYPYACHYGAAKAGVMHLTKSLAAEWGPMGIRVNAIAPGVVDTALFKEAEAFFKVDRNNLIKRVPLGRLGQPEDIAGVTMFLVSDASAYITGQTIIVNGGLEYLLG